MTAMISPELAGRGEPSSTLVRNKNTLVDLWAWLYLLIAPGVAIAIIMTANSFTAGGDFCDRSYYGQPSGRDAEFHVASLIIVISSIIMILVGFAVAAVILSHRNRFIRWRLVRIAFSFAALAVAVAGYLVLIANSDFSTDCGGFI